MDTEKEIAEIKEVLDEGGDITSSDARVLLDRIAALQSELSAYREQKPVAYRYCGLFFNSVEECFHKLNADSTTKLQPLYAKATPAMQSQPIISNAEVNI